MVELKCILSKRRIEKFKENVRREYDQDSIIKAAFSWRYATPSDTIPLVQIGARFLAEPNIFIDSYSAGGVYTVPEMVNLGRSIALGEQKYLIEMLQRGIQKVSEQQSFTFEVISRAVEDVGPGFKPNAAFIPLDFFVPLHTSKEAEGRILYEGHDCFLHLGSFKLRVFWSSNYVPFGSLIFVDKELGEWIVKLDPKDKHWVTINIESANEKVEVEAKTVARYLILEPKAGLILKVPPPE